MSGALRPEDLAELKTLGELKASGLLSNEEFDIEKNRILGQAARESASQDNARVEEVSPPGDAGQGHVNDEPSRSVWGDEMEDRLSRMSPSDPRLRFYRNAKVQHVFEEQGVVGIFKLGMFFTLRCVLAIYTLGVSELLLRKVIRPRRTRGTV